MNPLLQYANPPGLELRLGIPATPSSSSTRVLTTALGGVFILSGRSSRGQANGGNDGMRLKPLPRKARDYP